MLISLVNASMTCSLICILIVCLCLSVVHIACGFDVIFIFQCMHTHNKDSYIVKNSWYKCFKYVGLYHAHYTFLPWKDAITSTLLAAFPFLVNTIFILVTCTRTIPL